MGRPKKDLDALDRVALWAVHLAPQRTAAPTAGVARTLAASPHPVVEAAVGRAGLKTLRNQLARASPALRAPQREVLADADAWAERAGLPLRPIEEIPALVAAREHLRSRPPSAEALDKAATLLVLERWSRQPATTNAVAVERYLDLPPDLRWWLDRWLRARRQPPETCP